MSSEQFTCETCEQTFDKAWSDEEAMSESREMWGAYSPEALAVICDDCFKRVTEKMP